MSAFPGSVLFKSSLEIIRNAGIKGFISAFDDVEEIGHEGII